MSADGAHGCTREVAHCPATVAVGRSGCCLHPSCGVTPRIDSVGGRSMTDPDPQFTTNSIADLETLFERAEGFARDGTDDPVIAAEFADARAFVAEELAERGEA